MARGSRGWRGLGQNTSANGLVVNGDDVTLYGLFVEHHQSSRFSGTAMAGGHISTSQRFLMIRRIRRPIRARRA